MGTHEVIIPVIFFLSIAAVWGAIILTRHKERMTMIDKGLKPEDIKSLYEKGTLRVHPLGSLKWGMVFVAVGIAGLIGMYLRVNLDVEEGIYPALMAVFGGLGLIAFYFIASRKAREGASGQ